MPTTVQKQFFKFLGVPPSSLPLFHRTVEERGELPESVADINLGNWVNDAFCRTVLKIVDSKFSKEFKTYTIEVEFISSQTIMRYAPGCTCPEGESNEYTLFTPASILVALYRTLDPNMLPQDQVTLIPPLDEKRMRIDKLKQEYLERFFAYFLEAKLAFDVVLKETSEIVIPANRTIHQSTLRNLLVVIEQVDESKITNATNGMRFRELVSEAKSDLRKIAESVV